MSRFSFFLFSWTLIVSCSAQLFQRDLTLKHALECSRAGEHCYLSKCCDALECGRDHKCRMPPENCSINGPAPNETNTILKFLAFGDTPYDEEVGPPFEGPEFECLRDTLLPGIISDYVDVADFIVHVGDLKKGGKEYSSYCNDTVYGSRQTLFGVLETAGLDFFFTPGDNEWNECDGYNDDPDVDDPAKEKWREYFASGIFDDFDRNGLPSGNSPGVVRQAGNSQNFYFVYHDIVFVSITEPAGDLEYNSPNADWITSSVNNAGNIDAIVIIGHSGLPNAVEDAMDAYADIPALYVKGNAHEFCFRYIDEDRYPKFRELTVDAFIASPQLVSIVRNDDGEIDFHTADVSYVCTE